MYKSRPGESIADMLAASGGPNTLADRSRVIVYHTDDPDMTGPPVDRHRPDERKPRARVVTSFQVLSNREAFASQIDHQSVLVRIEGEVNQPGIYVAPNTPTSEIIAKAGGWTPQPPYGTKFTRQSVKIQQQDGFGSDPQLELTLRVGTPYSQFLAQRQPAQQPGFGRPGGA